MKVISKTIWILGLVSLFTHMASEMLYPIMPLFLHEIGYTALFIGFLEGTAEAVAGLSKSYFGQWSDGIKKRVPFVQLGYGLSAISKPMLAIFTYPWWIFTSRTMDRMGKGIRTGARDALLSKEATPQTKARVFGFHRAMDTFGAVIGPFIALVYLHFYPSQYTSMFLLAFVPGAVASAFSLLLKEGNAQPKNNEIRQRKLVFSLVRFWKKSSDAYKKLLVGLLVFALVNSSDVFLLLQMKESGIEDTMVIGAYIFYNFIYAISAYPMGKLADGWGLKKTFLLGLLLFVIVYGCFPFAHEWWMFLALLFLYGIYAAATEGISKAWISNITHKEDTATAIGTYSGMQSIAAFFASSTGGIIWYWWGAVYTFSLSAMVVVLVMIYLRFSSIAEK